MILVRNLVCFSDPYSFGTHCRRPLIFQAMNFVRSNNLSLKYQRSLLLGGKDKEIRNFEWLKLNSFGKFRYLTSVYLSKPTYQFQTSLVIDTPKLPIG